MLGQSVKSGTFIHIIFERLGNWLGIIFRPNLRGMKLRLTELHGTSGNM